MLNIDLNTELSKISRLNGEQKTALKKLKLFNIKDLLNYFPERYLDDRENRNIQNIKKGDNVILFGELKNLKIKRSFKGHIPMCEGQLVDLTGSIKLVWFHQAYIAKMYNDGEFVKVSGIVQEKNNSFSILNPVIDRVSKDHIFFENSLFDNGIKDKDFIPIYKETKGISSLFLFSLIKKCILEYKILDKIKDEDMIEKNILNKLFLPSLDKAYLYIHLPKDKKQILVARKRFSFQEIFLIQIIKQLEKEKAKHNLSYKINSDELNNFIKHIEKRNGFSLTKAQRKVINEISNDLNKKEPMGRLLEGDVGSGKTLVAEIISFLTTHYDNRNKEENKRLQVAIMAPTEILATQHFESFSKTFINENIEIGLLTSKNCKKFPSKQDKNKATNISKNELIKNIGNGNISIIIGTHSLIQKSVSFNNLALVIVDEQHRFGVKQRKELANKKSLNIKTLVANDIKNKTNKKQKIIEEKFKLPHLLSMTATPIPRTLALTIFGDLDLSIIDEMPKERKPIITNIAKEKEREDIYKEIISEIKKGYQAYIIVPRIDELNEEELQNSKKLNLRSVKSEIKNIEKFLEKEGEKNIKVYGLSGKIKKEEKEIIMERFLKNEIQILIATSVIEVGVNVRNASRMIIEAGERFGLAQLHQLRGRIGRGERESICYIFSNANNENTKDRLNALIKAKNGFSLAEYDLEQRGIGVLGEGKQWGVSDLAMEAIKNIKLVEIAKEEAKKIIEKDNNLIQNIKLKKIIEEKEKIHFE